MPSKIEIEYRAAVDGAVKDINKVNEAVGGSASASKGATAGLADVKAGLDLAVGAYKLVEGAVKSVIDPTVEYAAQVRTLGRTIGATAEESSKLIQAADDVGVSAETLQGALQAAIRKGVKPTIEGIGKLADQYNDIQDPIDRTKFLMDNFGKSGAALGPLMEQGAAGIRAAGDAAEEMGLVLDQQAIDAARRYEIAIDNWDDSLMSVKLTIAEQVLPAVSGLIDTGTDFVQVAKNQVEALASGNMTMIDGYKYTLDLITGTKSLADVNAELTRGVIGNVAAFDASAARMQGLADYYTATATPAVDDYTTSLYYQTLGLDAMQAAQLLARDALAATTPAAYGLLTGTDLLNASMAGLTTQMIYNKAAANLDEEAALALGLSMGLVDTRVLVLNQGLTNLKIKYDANRDGTIDAAEAADGYTAAVNLLTGSLLAVPDYTESTVRVMHITEYTEYYNDPNRPVTDRRASGGPVAGGGAYLVGEQGPEMMFPNTGGNVMNNDLLTKMVNALDKIANSGATNNYYGYGGGGMDGGQAHAVAGAMA